MRVSIIRRVGRSVLVVLLATTASFALLRLAPGDATTGSVEGRGRSVAARAALAERLGLERPLPVQLARYAGDVLRGRLGVSSSEGRPVVAVLGDALPATVLLSGTALVLATLLGMCIGTLHGWRPDSRGARVAATALTAGYAMPEVVLGTALLAVFALHLGLFPAGGLDDPLVALTGSGMVRWRDRGWHLVLPATALALSWSAGLVRQQRQAVRAMAADPHVRAARARGVAPWRLLMRHVLRPSVAGSVALLGTMLPAVVGGTIVVESLFSWPGMGSLLVQAVTLRDAPLVGGIVIVVSAAVAAGSLLTELLVSRLDPRLRTDETPRP
ncbi:MAG: ABC transporter permease [Gemmatimonas sp.]|jgi:peptide/nickel transport system permease protein|uniref:ABC transporter permease n=1 Tax=Gemmatimonas sp. TaxID=1962908 RepID=UPI00391F512E|nr:ABC transporter permease [Gemmatimonadota bacterium]